MSNEGMEKKPIYKKWWFWLIIVIVILALGSSQTQNSTQQTATNEIESTSQDYTFYSSILKNDSKEKIDKIIASEFITNEQLENIYQEREKDNTAYETYKIWVFSNEENAKSNDNYEIAEVKKENNNIVVTNVAEEKRIAEQEAEEKKKQEEEIARKQQEESEFKASCQTYTFDQMARNPENFKGTNVKVTGEVVQALYGTSGVDLRVNITKEGTYTTYYTDTIYVVYYPESGEDKILEGDVITIYGTSQGDYTYTSTLGASINLPLVYGKYIELN